MRACPTWLPIKRVALWSYPWSLAFVRLLRYLLGIIANPWLWWLGFSAWVGLIYFASSIPSGPPVPFLIPHLDKFIHAIAFAVGAFLLSTALTLKPAPSSRVVYLTALAVLTLYAVLDELHQLYTPGRSGGDVGDMIADVIGTCLGIVLFTCTYERFIRTLRPHARAAEAD